MTNLGSFESGTYALKYTHTGTDPKKRGVLLEIYQRGATVNNVLEIADLRQLHIEMQGAQGSIDTPVIKTNLTFSMVDSYDRGVDDDGKHGNWSEFYTPDSTLYMVVLKTKEPGSNTWDVRWKGYVTPDSWQESLDYYGDITIVARDNLGHLQDFEFDMTGDENGMVSIYEIIVAAMTKINMPMNVILNDTASGDAAGIQSSDGILLRNACINVSHFKDSFWDSVLEEVMEGIGWICRYTDDNTITFGPMRNMTLFGKTSRASVPDKDAVFLVGSSKSINPAYRRIVEVMQYDTNQELNEDRAGGLAFTGSNGTVPYTIHSKTADGWTITGNGYGEFINNIGNLGWKGAQATFLSVSGKSIPGTSTEGEAMREYTWIMACTTGYVDTSYSFLAASADVKVLFRFAPNPGTCYASGSTRYINNVAESALKQIAYKVSYTKGGTTKWWDGSGWGDSSVIITKDYDYENSYDTDLELTLGPSALGRGGIITVYFQRIVYVSKYQPSGPLFARLESISVSAFTSICESSKVTTINDSLFNVTLERQPEFGVLSIDTGRVDPRSYENILYYRDSNNYPQLYSYNCKWTGAAAEMPLPVLIHLQILCYHITAMEVLEGDFQLSVSTARLDFASIYDYKGGRYVVINGTLDFIRNRMTGVSMRQFIEYEDLWEDTTSTDYRPANYDVIPNNGGGNAGHGGGGGGAQPAPAGASALTDLTDVTLTDLAANDFLQYNGTAWANITATEALKAMVGTTAVGSNRRPVYWDGTQFKALDYNWSSSNGYYFYWDGSGFALKSFGEQLEYIFPYRFGSKNGTADSAAYKKYQTSLTNSSDYVPTSSAVVSYVSGVISGLNLSAAATHGVVSTEGGITTGETSLPTAGAVYDYINDSSNWGNLKGKTVISDGSGINENATGLTTGAAVAEYVASHSANNYITGFSWNDGSTDGPTATITRTGLTSLSVSAIPAAASNKSGVVTTGTQTFAGEKTFTGNVNVSGKMKAAILAIPTTAPSSDTDWVISIDTSAISGSVV